MPQFTQDGKIHPAVATIIVIVLIGIVTSVVIAVQTKNEMGDSTTTTQNNDTQAPASQDTSNQSTDTSSYANGTYSATGSYVSPGGRESIGLTVTIENGIITATELTQNADDREAQQYQSAFADGYAELVVGKNVDEVSLSRVAGSSLTSNGFNDALDQIKEDAAV